MGVAHQAANSKHFLSDAFCTCVLAAEGPNVRRGKVVGLCSLYTGK